MLRQMQRPLVACLLPIIPTFVAVAVVQAVFHASAERGFCEIAFKIGIPVATYLFFLVLIFLAIRWLKGEEQEFCSTDVRDKRTEYNKSDEMPPHEN